jgi:hypothetical protein
MGRVAYRRDPFTKESWGFVHETQDQAEDVADLHEEIALAHGLTFKEIGQMARLAVFKTFDVFKDNWKPDLTLEKLTFDRKTLTKYAPGLAELLEIHDRARRAIALLAEQESDPAKRERLVALLEPSEEWQQIERLALAQAERTEQ